ncbi:MAG: 30S ribosomal protein S6--L-glutamate ligase [Flavobacteriaceae bacterium]|nr:30S ribosomal protein S6--L-glutamate ligase [Flavobacteriaceae bacterium]
MCKLLIIDNEPVLQYYDETIDDLHAVIPRIGASHTYFGVSLVRHLEALGVFSVVSAEAIQLSRDKWSSFQTLIKHGVAVPKTVLFSNLVAESVVAEFNEQPVVIKLLEGTHGQGVTLTEKPNHTIATLEMLQAANQTCIVQEFIEESKGKDLRVIVVDGEVVASMKRQSKAGDFRSNLHRGGSSTTIALHAEEEAIAIKAAKALKLGVCGVDLLQSNRGPLVLEVNSTPGLEGIETSTGVDISGKIISYIERNKK